MLGSKYAQYIYQSSSNWQGEMTTPEEIVASTHATARHYLTPCGDAQMNWHVWGGVEPVVLLHGGMGSWMHWIRNVPALAQKFMLLVPDMPGHMESALPPEPYTPESIAAILIEGINEIIGPSRHFSVVGFSFGAAIGGHVARLAGSRARILVLVSPGGLGLPRGETQRLHRWRDLESSSDRRAALARNLQISMIADPSHADDLAVYIHSESVQRAKLVSAPVSLSRTLQECLPQVCSRLAGIWGADDPASSPYMAERLEFFHRIQPSAYTAIIPGASHWVQYEAANRFNVKLYEILTEYEPA
jgi:2-hydroxy-6-oxonona-2,4-dienedioate hydrolase